MYRGVAEGLEMSLVCVAIISKNVSMYVIRSQASIIQKYRKCRLDDTLTVRLALRITRDSDLYELSNRHRTFPSICGSPMSAAT